jgi:hypothetical protein
MTRKRSLVLAAVATLAPGGLGLSACAPGAAPAVAAHSAILPLTGEPCPVDTSAGAEFTAEATQLRFTVTAPDMQAPVFTQGDVGALTIDDVPAGAGRVVGLFGLAGQAPAWRGVVQNVTVNPDEDKQLNVLMARIADLTCSRGADADKRAFATATVLKDGSILVVGGAKESAEASATCGVGCRRLTPSASASIYDPTTGAFTPVAPMVRPRMFHTATLLDDGRVVIAGGAGAALVHPSDNPQFPFPIEPQNPVSDIEIFDPAKRAFEAGGPDPGGARVFAAAALTPDGEVLITGGVSGAATPNDLSNALDSTTLCSGDPLQCHLGPPMAAHRAGHTLFRIDPDGVFAWGGSVDVDSANGVPRYQLEVLRSGSSSFQLLNVAQMFANRNVFFAAVAQYMPFRVISAGGLVRNPDGTFRPATVTVTGQADGGAVYVYDASFDVAGGISVGRDVDAPLHLQDARFFGAAAPLPGSTRALVAGGFLNLDFAPSNDVELFDQDTLNVVPLLVGGQPRTLREPRGGLVAAQNGDGTIVFFGGEAPDPSGRAPSSTAEIFADPLTPPGVAE